MSDKLPDKLISQTLNARSRRVERGKRKDGKIPTIHVSSLIKSSSQDFFCPREFVLKHIEDREAAGAGLPPKFELLFGVGHFYGEYIVEKFLERNPEWAKYAWGNWRCMCMDSKRTRTLLPKKARCKKCGGPVNIYVEVDLFNPAGTVIGHADLIMFYKGVYYVYEFKSIERADVVFENINEPLGDHLTQASNYFYMLKSEGKKVSRLIRFVYVDRSMSGLYTDDPFREVSNLAIRADRLARFYIKAKKVHKAFKSRTLPPRKCKEIGCSRATQCTVAVSCFERKQTCY